VQITKPFYLGVYEVTQGEYEKVMGKNPSNFSRLGGGKEKVAGIDTARFPVERVSWDDAQEFCRGLSSKEGRQYRLPTEAQWEYACRGGTKTPFNFGGALNGDQANMNGNYPYGTTTKGEYLKRPTPVGTYSSNAFGLYDMHGNVWEWCSDWFGGDYYAKSPASDPPGPSIGRFGVIRGGGWDLNAVSCRSANRTGSSPDSRISSDLGFRVALVPSSQ
jgi:formylglycine-generating enzyme required for sulfatase activity